jgi:hypothetical protein
MNDTGVSARPGAVDRTGTGRRLRRLAGTGVTATLAAMLVTTLAAALARAAGVDVEVSADGEAIQLAGFAW